MLDLGAIDIPGRTKDRTRSITAAVLGDPRTGCGKGDAATNVIAGQIA
jgi:hypothetical protein